MAKKRHHQVFNKKSSKVKGAKAKRKRQLDPEELAFIEAENRAGDLKNTQVVVEKQTKELNKLEKKAEADLEKVAKKKKESKTPYQLLLESLEAEHGKENMSSDDDEDDEIDDDDIVMEEVPEDELADEVPDSDEDAEEEPEDWKDVLKTTEESDDEEEEENDENEDASIKKDDNKIEDEPNSENPTSKGAEDHFPSFFGSVPESKEWTRKHIPTSHWTSCTFTGSSGEERSSPSKLPEYFTDNTLLQDKVKETFTKKELSKESQETELFHYLNAYNDIHVTDHRWESNERIRNMYALHIANHIRKTRVKEPKPPKEGFTRVKCLIVAPYRSAAYDIVNRIFKFYPKLKQIGNTARLKQEYGPEDENEAEPTNDYSHLMYGRNDDQFRFGISFTTHSAKLFTQFYKSDIIVCSPLGLRMVVGSREEKNRDFDFLSSVDIAVFDRADALRMQNWNHLQECLQVLNVQPAKMPETCDIYNLRDSYINKSGRLYRQTIVTSNGTFPDMRVAFHDKFTLPKKKKKTLDENVEESSMQVLEEIAKNVDSRPRRNFRGLMELSNAADGTPMKTGFSWGIARQMFVVTRAPSAGEIPESMFETFKSRVWPTAGGLERLLIVVSGNDGYGDFCRLRQFFQDEGTNYGFCHEYSDHKELSKSRKEFFDGVNRVLLITERWWFLRRYKIKGAGQILFYGVPETPLLYSDALSWMKVPSRCNAMTLLEPKYEACALEAIVGTQQALSMQDAKPNKIFSIVNPNTT